MCRSSQMEEVIRYAATSAITDMPLQMQQSPALAGVCLRVNRNSLLMHSCEERDAGPELAVRPVRAGRQLVPERRSLVGVRLGL